ncbi:MAG TPA: Hsp20/alpha crystallin family protein [Candidatus Eisenbacteria bacterium]|nr:Hsp20/alpha crystallin family protein [Candidatus Eisenbacteria bacterium]
MERDRSKMGEPTRRTEERGRWRDAATRDQENVEREMGGTMDRDRTERDRLERERLERDRLERERMERESRGEVTGRGTGGGSSLAMRDPLLASHFDFMRQFMREMSRMFEGWPFSSRAMFSPGSSPGYGSTGQGAGYGYGAAPGGQGSLAGWPPIEVEERDGRMVVRAELPGIDMQDVRVRLEGSYLVIEGDRRDNRERKGEGFFESEWSYGRFSRRIPVPPGVTQEMVGATCGNGVLELTIDVPTQDVREIPIRAGRSGSEEDFDERRRERGRDRDQPARTQH